ncbi:rod shape-determining protein MreC [Marinisporobacter balticus]|uniref:Cell shape-determining protein MreC n=1 Tax=Marinisporobacter balticus TaxID=2018667 RepID=A0A4R2LKS4_9FIRM|nr:rod shape-determining protein MreC [Marinisporobacter balticus]TCO79985.1 rod shape-determining protein MreC [Marinisporobacter balticus]
MIVTFVTIIIIIAMGITIGGRAKVSVPENLLGKIITPVQKILYKGGQVVDDGISSLFTFRTISKENKTLKKEIAALNQKVIALSLTRDELDELKNLQDALKYVSQNHKKNYVTASVTGKDVGNWFKVFIIDAGKNQGVRKNSTIMNGEGLIGRVYEVGDSWSKVISIIDKQSSVSFQVLRNNQYLGVVRGSLKGELMGYLIEPEADVVVGDKLITSGLSMYEKGILIGEIKEVVKKEDELLKTIIVEPVVNFKKIDKVFIIIPDGLD